MGSRGGYGLREQQETCGQRTGDGQEPQESGMAWVRPKPLRVDAMPDTRLVKVTG